MRLTKFVLLLAVVAVFLFCACSQPYPSYGVILWSADETKISTGSAVAALAHSQLRKTVQVMLIDNKEKVSGDPVSVESWRVKEFPNFREMRQWLESNKDCLKLFVRSQKLALPVRSDPAIRDGNINYRMRDQEDAKVLSKEDKEGDAGGLKGYWYEIMTQTGTHGWVFSAQILPWRLGETAAANTDQSQDQQVQSLFNGNWRPDEFTAMIDSGNYDLGFFKPSTGLSFDPKSKTIHLATEKDVLDLNYQSIDKIGRNIWTVSGTNIQITFRDEKSVVVQYQKGNNVLTRVFSNIDKNIDELYQTELDRRYGLIKRLAGKTGTITSGSYGSITIDGNGNFTWNGCDSLRPQVVPNTAQNTGNISFDLYLGPELRENYRGVASFNFAGNSGIEQVNFLYLWKPDGVQLEFVPTSLIKGREVKKADSSPTVLFFGF